MGGRRREEAGEDNEERREARHAPTVAERPRGGQTPKG
jgi:hypothetical protein